ncbi:MAG: universal stress protein [Alphaproteobacteria bacterium]
MRTLLVHIEDCPDLMAILKSALIVARQFGGHMEGLYVPQGLPSMLPLSPEGGLATADVMASLEQGAEDAAHRLRADFERFMTDQDVSVMPIGAAIDAPSASWFEAGRTVQDTLGGRARAFDLVVVGRPVSGQFAPSMVALETALFESGRPLLIVPPGGSETIGTRVAIAWNGSTETARTIALAKPFLRRAEEVAVISVEEEMVPGPSGQEIAQNLARGGIVSRTRHVQRGHRAVGETMLEECRAFGADLIVKGAYTQSRLRQMIFGGVTSHILAKSNLPVLMAN